MKVYGLSGLGADKRVFQHLKLAYELNPLDWIQPNSNEPLKEYANRLAKKIDTTDDFILIGMSFGGIIAVEINKIVKPAFVILISSAEVKEDIRSIYRIIGKTGIVKWVPTAFFKPPAKLAEWVFGANNKKLLREIINDTDLRFAKWAIEKLITWDNIARVDHCFKIHGDKDILIPSGKDNKTIILPGGHHFMIVDRAEEISEMINNQIQQTIIRINTAK